MALEAAELNTFIEGLIESGASEDSIFTQIATKTEKGILAAVRIYKQFLKDTGRTLSVEDRKLKIKELLDPLVATEENGTKNLDISKATALLVDQMGISAQAARSNVHKFCEANQIAIPVRNVLSKEEVAKYASFVIQGVGAGASKKEIVEKLVADHKLDEAVATKVYARIAKENGLLAERVKYDMPAIALFVKANIVADTAKKDFCAKVEAEFNLPASTSSKLFSSWQFALLFQAAGTEAVA